MEKFSPDLFVVATNDSRSSQTSIKPRSLG